MMTLREFIEDVNSFEHFRIYQPNRDCLIYESYFRIHSKYNFKDDKEMFQEDYWNDNDYCGDVLHSNLLDDETETFLNKFGDYIVFKMECGSFRPSHVYKDSKGNISVEPTKEETMPGREYLECFDLFIVPNNDIGE